MERGRARRGSDFRCRPDRGGHRLVCAVTARGSIWPADRGARRPDPGDSGRVTGRPGPNPGATHRPDVSGRTGHGLAASRAQHRRLRVCSGPLARSGGESVRHRLSGRGDIGRNSGAVPDRPLRLAVGVRGGRTVLTRADRARGCLAARVSGVPRLAPQPAQASAPSDAVRGCARGPYDPGWRGLPVAVGHTVLHEQLDSGDPRQGRTDDFAGKSGRGDADPRRAVGLVARGLHWPATRPRQDLHHLPRRLFRSDRVFRSLRSRLCGDVGLRCVGISAVRVLGRTVRRGG